MARSGCGRGVWGLVLLAILAFTCPIALSQEAGGGAAVEGAKVVRLATLDWPPYTGKDLPEGGIDTYILRKAFEHAGYKLEVEFMAWADAIEAARTDRFDGYYPRYYSEAVAREWLLSAPFDRGPLNFIQRTKGPVEWKSWSDLRKVKIGYVKDYELGSQLREKIATSGVKLTLAASDVDNLLNLAQRKVDLAIIDPYVFNHLMRTDRRLMGANVPLEVRPPVQGWLNLYVALKKNERGQRLKDALDGALAEVNSRALRNEYVRANQNELPGVLDMFVHLDWGEVGGTVVTGKPYEEVKWTPEEATWLAAHPKIRIGIMQAWPPMDFVDSHGQPQGIGSDYIRALNRRLGGILEIVPGAWKEIYEGTKEKRLDAVMDITPREDRKEFFNFTQPYIEVPHCFVARKDGPYWRTFEELEGKKLAVERGFFIVGYVKDNFDDITVAEYDSTSHALDAVAKGEADAYFGNRAVAMYLMRKELISNLQVQGRSEVTKSVNAIGVRKDWPELAGILDKALGSITREEQLAIHGKWGGPVAVGRAGWYVGLPSDLRDWLESHPRIRIGVQDAWPPLNFVDDDGNHRGLGAQYIAALNDRLGGVLEVVPQPFSESLEAAKEKRLDALMDVTPKPDREVYLNFTKPYLTIPHVIIGRKDETGIETEDDLKGRTVALERGYYTVERYRREYGDAIKVVEYDNTSECLNAVARGEADAYVGNRAVAFYIMEQELLVSLRVLGKTDRPPVVLAIGVRKDWPELATILDRTFSALSREEVRAIHSAWVGVEKEGDLTLTEKEREWIRLHPVIRVHNEKNWPPFNFYENSQPKGFSIDYMNLLASKLGIEVRYVTGPEWNEFLQMLRERELDVMLNIVKTEDREKYILFTESYARNPNVIISRTKKRFKSIEDLKGLTVAVTKGFFHEEVLRKNYPEVKLLAVPDVLECLKAVSFGRADATLQEEAVARYVIAENMLTGLTISGEVEIGDPDLPKLRIGVRNDWPELQALLGKAMKSVTSEEMMTIRERWIASAAAAAQPPASEHAGWLDALRTMALTVGIIVVLAVGVWALMRFAGDRLPESLQNARGRSVIIVSMAIFLTIVVSGTLIGLANIERRARAGVGESLQMSVEATHRTLRAWVETERVNIEGVASDPHLLPLIKELLTVERTPEALLASDELKEVREHLAIHDRSSNNLGFFLIAPDKISIGSRRDENVGTTNLIAEQRPALLKAAFEGHTVLVPPIRSDVALPDGSGEEKKGSPTMFMATPVRDEDGKVIAVMTLRWDVTHSFSQLCQTGRMGRSGETYAFDAAGNMLSETRFPDQLAEMGLIEPGDNGVLSLRVCDPGGDMTQGFVPTVPRLQQPLTRMAAEAVQQRSGQDLKGYRDYRGVLVLGAWVWDRGLNVGLASEINEEEALARYRANRNIVAGILGVTVLLTFLLTGFTVWSGERSRRALRHARDEWEQVAEQRTAELREREERFRGYFEYGQMGMAITAPEQGWVEANDRLCEMLGYPREELLQMTWAEITHPEDLVPDQEQFQRMLAGEVEGYAMDKRFIRKDGSVLYTNLAVSCARDEQGAVSDIMASILDITERKKAEEAVAEAEERSRLLLESAGEGIFGVNTDGKMTFINPAALRMLGFEPEEVMGRAVHDLVHHSHADGARYDVADCPMAKAYNDGTRRHVDDEVLWRKDGSSFDVDYTSTPIRKDDTLIGAVVTFRDVTSLKRTELIRVSRSGLLEQFSAECELEEFYEAVMGHVGDIFPGAPASILLLDEADRLHGAATRELPDFYNDAIEGLEIGPTIGSCGASASLKKTVIAADIETHPNWAPFRDLTRKADLRACWSTPIVSSTGKVLGTFAIYSRRPATPTDEDLGLLEDTARLVSLMIERKQAEEALRDAEEQSRLLLESAGEGIFGLDTDGCITFINPAALRMLGYEAEELMERTLHDLIHYKKADGSAYPVAECPMARAYVDGSRHHVDDEVLWRKDGTALDVDYTSTPIQQDGRLVGAVVTFRDVTEIRRAEAELHRNLEELERFNRLAVGRELRMISLKEEINEMLQAQGQNGKYTIIRE